MYVCMYGNECIVRRVIINKQTSGERQLPTDVHTEIIPRWFADLVALHINWFLAFASTPPACCERGAIVAERSRRNATKRTRICICIRIRLPFVAFLFNRMRVHASAGDEKGKEKERGKETPFLSPPPPPPPPPLGIKILRCSPTSGNEDSCA